jgi:hypothetical protein
VAAKRSDGRVRRGWRVAHAHPGPPRLTSSQHCRKATAILYPCFLPLCPLPSCELRILRTHYNLIFLLPISLCALFFYSSILIPVPSALGVALCPLPSVLCTSPSDLYPLSSDLNPYMLLSFLCSRCSPRSLRSFSVPCLFPDTAVRCTGVLIYYAPDPAARTSSSTKQHVRWDCPWGWLTLHFMHFPP